MATYDCLVIGSGFAGLCAARVLAPAHRVLVLEARPRVGGRAQTHVEGDFRVDLGCAQVHGWNEGNPVRGIMDCLNLTAHVSKGAQVVVVAEAGPLDKSDAAGLLSTSRSLSYTPSHPPPHPSASVASMLLPTLTTPRLEALARTTEIGAGVPLEDLSAKYWGFGRGFGGTDAAPVGGYVEVIEKLRGEIQKAGVEVRLEEEVVGIEDRADGGVQVTTRGGQVYRARTCISTIPLGVLKISPPAFDPPLPPQFLSALQRTAVGVLEKVVLSYSKAWWPEPSTTGTFLVLPTLASTPNPGSLADVFASTTLSVNTFTFAKTPSPSILVYLGANAGASMSPYSSSEIGTALHTYLKARLSVPSAPCPLSTLSTDWLSDPFSRGATSSPVTLAQSDDGERASPLDFVVLGRSMWEGRMGFAGEHTDMDSRGSVVGAVVSGEREGRRVKGMLDRSSLGKL